MILRTSLKKGKMLVGLAQTLRKSQADRDLVVAGLDQTLKKILGDHQDQVVKGLVRKGKEDHQGLGEINQ